MLKRLGEWLDSWDEFSVYHEDFVNLLKTVLIGLVGVALIAGFVVVAFSLDPDAPSIRWEGDVTLQDTRRVHCVRFHDGGVSCDWSRADGSDNL